MNKFGLSKNNFNKILSVVNKYPYKFYIFGSRARGDYKKTSDIDIAIKGKVSAKERAKIWLDFEELDIIYFIDIIYISDIKKKELLRNIEIEGVLINDSEIN